MSEWWTYRLSSFLLFSAQTYRRLFELYNADVWPAQIATVALGLAMFALLLRMTTARTRVALAMAAALWALVGWAFQYRRYATINWAAEYFALAFALEAVALAAAAVFVAPREASAASSARVRIGRAIVLFAVACYPLLAPLFGRGAMQADVFGLTPDPTAVGTLGALVLVQDLKRWPLAVVPMLWCVTSGLTLWSMDAADAAIAPLAALIALPFLFGGQRAR